MKVLTILGTRPEIIRLSRIIPKLDELVEQVIVHTGQNYDPTLDKVFFDELKVRAPNYHLGAKGNFAEQLATISVKMHEIFEKEKPDRFLVLGDTNSSLAAIVAKRLGIPVYHMEAGNRCFDERVPEEVNRKLIDHSSDILLPYTQRSRENLIREGIQGERIYVTGNPIWEVINHYEPQISGSQIFKSLNIKPGKYFLVTTHRAENVDVEERFSQIVSALSSIASEYKLPVIVSTHPRTKARMEAFGLKGNKTSVRFLEPFGFFDFIALEKNAFCVLSDSGTVQEECAIFGVPSVTLRDVTERPETLDCGSNILCGADKKLIEQNVKVVTSSRRDWTPPEEYCQKNVSDVVAKIVLSYSLRARLRTVQF